MCGKAKAAPAMQSQKMTHGIFELNLFHIAILAVNYQTNHPWKLLSPPFLFVGNPCKQMDNLLSMTYL